MICKRSAWKSKAARKTNEKGYVTIATSELGADEDYYMTVGYEVQYPNHRSQSAEANYIKGAEIFYCYLEENNSQEDVYVAGVSLNGFDCKWYAKNMYIVVKPLILTAGKYLKTKNG